MQTQQQEKVMNQTIIEEAPFYAPEAQYPAMQPISATASVMAAIVHAASDSTTDLTKMEALEKMYERFEAREAKKSFAQDYAKMAAELPKVMRNKENTHSHYKYATLDEINFVVNPILGKYGFSTSTPVKQQTLSHVTVMAIIKHRDGHAESCEITMPMDNAGLKGNANKTDTQAIGSSVTYARRTALCALLNIAASADDKDGAAPDEKISELQAELVNKKLAQCAAAFQASFKEAHGEVPAIPKSKFDTVIAVLNREVTKHGGAK